MNSAEAASRRADAKRLSKPRNPNPGLRRFLPAGILVIVGLLYLPTLWYGFVWDDGHLLVRNQFLARAGPLDILTRGFWYNPEYQSNSGDMSYYRPLTTLTFYFERREYGLNPFGFHLTNLAIHLLTVALMFLVLRRFLASDVLAAAGALAWGINPAINCIVAFVSGRTYLLAMLMLMLSLYLLIRGQRRAERLGPLLFGLSFLLAIMSLESAIGFAALALAWLAVNRRQYQRFGHWLAAVATAPVVYFVLRLFLARISLMPESVARWAVSEPLRLLNCFGQQLALFVFPFNQKVIYTVGPEFTDFSVYTVLGGLFLLVPVVVIVLARGGRAKGTAEARTAAQRPRLTALFGYGWMVLFLAPFANLLFLGPSGRMLYLSGFGLVLMLLVLLQAAGDRLQAFGNKRGIRGAAPEAPVRISNSGFVLPGFQGQSPWLSRQILVTMAKVAAAVYLAAFAFQLVRRNPVWRSELTLSAAMVREAPDSPGGHLNYGAALAEAGRKDEAILQYRLAIEADSGYVPPYNRLAFALVEKNDLAGAVEAFRGVVLLDSTSADSRNNLALTLKQLGLLDSAVHHYRAALRFNPGSDTTLNNLGRAYMAQGELRQAIVTFRQVLARSPAFLAARSSLAETYLAAGFPDSAAMFGGIRGAAPEAPSEIPESGSVRRGARGNAPGTMPVR